MKEKEIVALLESMPDCNFVASTISAWHAHGTDATIRFLQDNGADLRGIIFMTEHPLTGKCIDESFFLTKSIQIKKIPTKFETVSWIKKIQNNLRAITNLLLHNDYKNQDEFYILLPSYPDLHWINIIKKVRPKAKPIFIVIDEGTSAYLVSDLKTWISTRMNFTSGHYLLAKKVGFYILGYFRQLVKQSILNKLSKENALYNHNLLLQDNGKLKPNERIVPYYSAVLTSIGEKMVRDDGKYSGCILLNTQCWMEENALDNDQDMAVYDTFFSVAGSIGASVVLKMHPREKNTNRYMRYKYISEKEQRISQEVLIAGLKEKPLCVIGISSTTLITLQLLFGIPAISMAKLLQTQDIPDRMRVFNNNFIRTFADVIKFPDNGEEMKNILQTIMESSGGGKR